MRTLTLAALALVVTGCNDILPTAPSKMDPAFANLQPYAPMPPLPNPPGPHFALEIQGPSTATEREPWRGVVFVGANINIPRPELPVRVITTCGGTVQNHQFSSGSVPFSCLLPLGVQTITAVAQMADGTHHGNDFLVTVNRVILPPLQVFYDVVESHANRGNTVIFSVRTVERADSYRFDFGDGSGTTVTGLPYATHRYENGSQERRVFVRAMEGDVSLTSGSVVGRW
jgi:hypothetical protein